MEQHLQHCQKDSYNVKRHQFKMRALNHGRGRSDNEECRYNVESDVKQVSFRAETKPKKRKTTSTFLTLVSARGCNSSFEAVQVCNKKDLAHNFKFYFLACLMLFVTFPYNDIYLLDA